MFQANIKYYLTSKYRQSLHQNLYFFCNKRQVIVIFYSKSNFVQQLCAEGCRCSPDPLWSDLIVYVKSNFKPDLIGRKAAVIGIKRKPSPASLRQEGVAVNMTSRVIGACSTWPYIWASPPDRWLPHAMVNLSAWVTYPHTVKSTTLMR